jgi:hypothetical protein
MKAALLAFRGETTCFAHVLLNALDLDDRGHEVAVIVEGAATKQIAELSDAAKPFWRQYSEVKSRGLIAAVCKACSGQTGALEAAQAQGLPLRSEMAGHPSLAAFLEDGYNIVTF